jgi:hypothetical protein
MTKHTQIHAIPKLSTRNEGLSKLTFTMTVMYRINQSVTTRIAQFVIDKELLSAVIRQMCYICGKTEI